MIELILLISKKNSIRNIIKGLLNSSSFITIKIIKILIN